MSKLVEKFTDIQILEKPNKNPLKKKDLSIMPREWKRAVNQARGEQETLYKKPMQKQKILVV